MAFQFKQQLVVLLLVTIVISCSPVSLFNEHWNKSESISFERSTSPYPDSPDAVVIWDLENLEVIKKGWDLIREHHVRIQIFTEEGKKYANIRIPYWYSNKISHIKAQTILPNGKRIPLKQEDIFDEGLEKVVMFKTFALPGVEDQCIIEYQYQIRTGGIGTTSPKYFQWDLHVEHSRFKVTLPGGFSYTANIRNPPDDYEEPVEEKIFMPHDAFPTKTFTWEYTDLKPLKNEPYIFNRKDHLFSLGLQLLKYEDNYSDITFVKTWENITDLLLEDYDSYFNSAGELGKLLEKIQKHTNTDELTPRDIFKYLRDEMTLRGFSGIFARDVHDVIRTNAASSAEKNLLLVVLLRQAGYEADAVIISRRSNGKISLSAPSIADFDHLIVQLREDEDFTLLDASDKYATFSLMPADNYSSIGMVVEKGEANFIKFPYHGKQSHRNIITNCQLSENGSLSGSFNIQSTGHYASALREVHSLTNDDLKFAYDELVPHIPGIIVDSVIIDMNLDDFQKPVKTKVYFQIPEFLSGGGEMIYFPSTFYKSFSENLLVDEERQYPIEFHNTFIVRETINLQLPQNIEIVETPKNIYNQGPDQFFRKQIQPGVNAIQFAWTFQRNENFLEADRYGELRNFYTNAIAADQAKLILKYKK